MKTAFAVSLLLASVHAFAPVAPRAAQQLTQQSMFSGAGEGAPEDPEELKQMEATAKSMGMSLEEYKIATSSRNRLVKQLDEARVSGGSADKILVTRDGHNPSKFFEITVTDAGKALGKDGFSKELVSALKAASDESKKARGEAQKTMMAFITEEMKKLGKA